MGEYGAAGVETSAAGVSIKDVSRVAAVSTSTVSHVLNGTRYVSPVLRQRVDAAVAQLGYRHNGLARSLRTRQTQTVGLIIPDVCNAYYPQLARGVQDAFDTAGYTVFLCNSDRHSDREAKLLVTLEERRVDGVILDASEPSEQVVEALRRFGPPVVLVGSRIDDPQRDVVKMAPHGGYEAVRHLITRGHRRIALIGGPSVPGGDRPAKAGGYLLALEHAGITPAPELMVRGDYSRAGGQRAMAHLLSLPQPPTAVFAGNDLMAIGALLAARAAGRCVPEGLAVAGYDDIPEAAVTSPALTTVAVPKYEMGRTAAELLLRRIRGDAPPVPQHVELAHHLVIREST